MKRPFKLGKLVWLLPLFALLTACGGGGGGGGTSVTPTTGQWDSSTSKWDDANTQWGS
jgi:hypothetical protein